MFLRTGGGGGGGTLITQNHSGFFFFAPGVALTPTFEITCVLPPLSPPPREGRIRERNALRFLCHLVRAEVATVEAETRWLPAKGSAPAPSPSSPRSGCAALPVYSNIFLPFFSPRFAETARNTSPARRRKSKGGQ